MRRGPHAADGATLPASSTEFAGHGDVHAQAAWLSVMLKVAHCFLLCLFITSGRSTAGVDVCSGADWKKHILWADSNTTAER
jgi:hypothetical protein